MSLLRFSVAIFLTLSTALWALPEVPHQEPAPRGFDFTAARQLVIQDRGRTKPLESFATDSVLFVTGRRTWKKLEAIEVLFGWLIAYDREWEEEPFIRIDHKGLKAELKLDVSRNYFTPKELDNSDGLMKIVRDAADKARRKERQSDLEKKAVQLNGQIGLLQALVSGQAFTLLPNPGGADKPWFPISALTQNGEPVPYTQDQYLGAAEVIRQLLDAFIASDAAAWKAASEAAVVKLRALGGAYYPPQAEVDREIHYDRLRPFHWSWILYTVGFLFLLGAIIAGKRQSAVTWWNRAGISFLVLGIGLHTYGFVVRCLISGRPPVTNMYESVLWVTWGCLLFAFVIWAAYRNSVILLASTVFSIAGLVLGDNLPAVLDPGIHPLEPVLRSNFWLTIHVLTITLSYAAFAVSLCLGNVVLWNYLFSPKNTEKIQEFSLYMYRAMQIGVVLLAAGTILGGVWADYSWGRFWGWDPKEVWALIALLLYLAVLHGRFTGWLRGFGFTATTVMAFLGVLMAWYGVNFVLGVGLHSYGFGTGGLGYVVTYLVAQLAYMGASYVSYRKHGKVNAPIFPRA